jgi:hypothetical protein
MSQQAAQEDEGMPTVHSPTTNLPLGMLEEAQRRRSMEDQQHVEPGVDRRVRQRVKILTASRLVPGAAFHRIWY